jgi:hypothetical protein
MKKFVSIRNARKLISHRQGLFRWWTYTDYCHGEPRIRKRPTRERYGRASQNEEKNKRFCCDDGN